MQLSSYLARIGIEGPLQPDAGTLVRLQRAHVESIPFENLDVLLQRRVETSIEQAYAKLVERGRGGWCYEMNGLFGWALGQLGYDVTRVAAGVMRETGGDQKVGNHLCLLVRHGGETWLLDAGFGGSLAAPLPLRAVQRDDTPYRIWLSEVGGGWWRFAEREQAKSDAQFSFDFRAQAADEALLERHSHAQQTEAGSNFVENLVAQRRAGELHLALRGRVLTTTRAASIEKRTLASAEELVATLRETFGLDVPEAAALWPSICARHDALFSR